MNGEICYICKKAMGNSLNTIRIVNDDKKIIKVYAHAKHTKIKEWRKANYQ